MRARAAYTLVEVILVVVVVGLAFPSLLAAFAEASRTSARPVLLATASNLAREKLEVLASDRFNASRGYSYLVTDNYPAETTVSGFLFSRSVAFTDVASSDLATVQSGSGYRKVVVTVSWQGGAERVTLSCVFTSY